MGKPQRPLNLLKLPDPTEWEPDGRTFEKTEINCKICAHPMRSLIEDLLTAGESGLNIVRWANHYKLFDKGLNEMNVSVHKNKHISSDLLPVSPSDISEQKALDQLLGMVDEDKLDLVAARGLISVVKGQRKPSVRESLMAIKIKSQLPKDIAMAELWGETLKKMRAREAENLVEGQVIEEE